VHIIGCWKLVHSPEPCIFNPPGLWRGYSTEKPPSSLPSRHVDLVGRSFPRPRYLASHNLHRWDATLALLSRQGPIIDQSYLDFLVRWEKQDEWSFFDLTGCPRDLLVHLFQLAELAKQSEIAASMKWLSFDMTPVLETEQKIVQWKNDIVNTEDEGEHELSDTEAERNSTNNKIVTTVLRHGDTHCSYILSASSNVLVSRNVLAL
jgi:hypothetical protein